MSIHDITVVPKLMEETEEEFYADSGYLGVEKRESTPKTNKAGTPIKYNVCARPSSLKKRFT